MKKFVARVGSTSYEAIVEGDTVAIDRFDHRFTVVPLGRDEYRILTATGASVQATVAGTGSVRWIFVDGETYEVEVATEAPAEKRRSSRGHDTLTAPMPATVIRVLTSIGSRVTAGDTLFVLEAMKMELPIRAPHDGTVAAIHCREGELVKPGATLAELRQI